MATRRTQRRSHRWWWFLNPVLIHRFSIAGVEKVQLWSKQRVVQKWVTFLFSHPIPKPFTKYGKEDVLEVVPYIEVVNHLGVGYCQASESGHVHFTDLRP